MLMLVRAVAEERGAAHARSRVLGGRDLRVRGGAGEGGGSGRVVGEGGG